MKVPDRFRKGITRYQPSDAASLGGFQHRTFGDATRQTDPDRHAWLFDNHPLAPDTETGLWVCHRDDTIVGQQGEIPFMLHADGHDMPAWWAVDLMVDDAWRLKGVGPALLATMLEQRPFVGAMNMSEQGAALMLRGGWTDLGIVPVYLRPLQLAQAASLTPGGRRLRHALQLASPALTAADAVASGTGRAAGLRLEPTAAFDRRADEVWERAAPDYPVLARRDHAVLAWLIDQRPDRERMQRFYLTRRGETIGYVVLRAAGTPEAPTAVVVDYLAAVRWVAPLLTAAAHQARRQGAVALSVKTRNEQADRRLRLAGFVRRQHGADGPIRFMVHSQAHAGLPEALTAPHNWFVTSADCDLEYATVATGAS